MIALMTTEDVASYARAHTKTVYGWIKKGANGKQLKVHRLPGTLPKRPEGRDS